MQTTQLESVDIQEQFEALVLRYLSSLWELLVPTFRIFEQFDWAPRNQNCKTDMELQIKIFKLLFQTYPDRSSPRLPMTMPMTNEDVLDRFRTFQAVKLQPVLSYRYERRHFRSDEHVITGGKSRVSNSRRLLGGGSFISVRLQDENSGATDSGGPLLPLWPISCVCR